jgi:cytochrome c-type biogenesis protein CcmH
LKRILTIATAILAAVLVAPVAHAGGTRAAQKKRAVEAEAKRIEKLLTAPCCYKGTLEDHASGLAVKMRSEIRTMLAAGQTRRQILAHYKKKYGQAVLVEPPGGGLSGFLLYGVPFGLAFLGLLVMTVLMVRGRAQSPRPSESLPTHFVIPADLERRIDALVEGHTRLESEHSEARG